MFTERRLAIIPAPGLNQPLHLPRHHFIIATLIICLTSSHHGTITAPSDHHGPKQCRRRCGPSSPTTSGYGCCNSILLASIANQCPDGAASSCSSTQPAQGVSSSSTHTTYSAPVESNRRRITKRAAAAFARHVSSPSGPGRIAPETWRLSSGYRERASRRSLRISAAGMV